MDAPITPAQIRAGRALLGLSQEDLAVTAKVSLSTVRDLEAQKRSAESLAANALGKALQEQGVVFIPGGATGGPGVRLAEDLPGLVRRPAIVSRWQGLTFDVAWQGTVTTVLVSSEVLEDLDHLVGVLTDEMLLQSFKNHEARILNAVARAITDPSNLDERGRLYVRSKDVFDVPPARGYRLEDVRVGMVVQLDPVPLRIWRGKRQESINDNWRVDRVDPEQGRIVIINFRTDHFLILHRVHIRDIRDVKPGSPDTGLLGLAVQVIFEDGRARLERLPPVLR